jgi:hypothetical protein
MGVIPELIGYRHVGCGVYIQATATVRRRCRSFHELLTAFSRSEVQNLNPLFGCYVSFRWQRT